MHELQKKKIKSFYAKNNSILKEEYLCTYCFIPIFFCQRECHNYKAENNAEFWKRRSNLFQKKFSLCCPRKRKIIGNLCRDYANLTNKTFYYNQFLIFISNQNKNGY